MTKARTPSVAFISLGCAKNTVDSQIMAGRLVSKGFSLASAPAAADVIIINTCSFIQSARTESISTIRDICRLKTKSRGRKKIIVTGCLPQKEQAHIADILPGVDAFAGVDQLNMIDAIVQSAVSGSSQNSIISRTSSRIFEPSLPGLAFSAGAYAYVKIAEGCNHKCSFCTIPSIRGKYRSRKPASIIHEAEKLLETGFREITLVAQDTTSYGRDLSGSMSLPKLLKRLDAVGGRFWIRFLYGFPGLVTPQLLETMASSSRICNYLDVPVQHSHPGILKLMRRSGTSAHTAKLPELARKFLPDVSLRTSIIAGFPGETQEHFQHLLDYLTNAEFDHVGIFPFSPEKDTPAAALKKQVPDTIVSKRIELLTDLQSRIFDKKAASMKRTSGIAMIERKLKDNVWLGRTQGQAPEVDSVTEIHTVSEKLQPGDFVSIRFKSHKGYTLKAVET